MKNYSTQVILFILVAGICLHINTPSLLAAIYEYTDENGKTYYTDNLENIPEKYRKKDEGVKIFAETIKETKEEKEARLKRLEKRKAEAVSSLKTARTKSKLVEDKSKTRASSSSGVKSKKRSLSSSSSSSPYYGSITTKKTSSYPKARKGSGY